MRWATRDDVILNIANYDLADYKQDVAMAHNLDLPKVGGTIKAAGQRLMTAEALRFLLALKKNGVDITQTNAKKISKALLGRGIDTNTLNLWCATSQRTAGNKAKKEVLSAVLVSHEFEAASIRIEKLRRIMAKIRKKHRGIKGQIFRERSYSR